jgi:hypothetical protein
VEIGEQVSLDVTNTATGQVERIIPDALYPNEANEYQIVDAKFSSAKDLRTGSLTSTLQKNQEIVYGWIRDGQPVTAVGVGRNAVEAGLLEGETIRIAPKVDIYVNGPTGPVLRTY